MILTFLLPIFRELAHIPIESFAHGYPGPKGLEVVFLDWGIFFDRIDGFH